MMFNIIRFFIIAILISFNVVAEVQPEPPSGTKEKKLVVKDNYMVVAANGLASKVGSKILAEGGNAIDAAIALQMVLNVVEPHASGIGGGAFLVYYDAASNSVITYDGRETAPKNISKSVFLDDEGYAKDFFEVVKGGSSVGVPGLVAMLASAHKDYGQKQWGELFKPAIKIANDGFILSPRLNTVIGHVEYLKEFKDAKDYFLNQDLSPKEFNTILYNKKLAETFEKIATNPIEEFYHGDIAKNIVANVNNSKINPGNITLEDLAEYKAVKRMPVCSKYRKYRVCGMGPPSSGGITVLQALGILENFDIGQYEPLSYKAVEYISGALKLAFADRNKYIADTDFVNVPVTKMLDKHYLKTRSRFINDMKAVPGELGNGFAYLEESYEKPSTTHISIVDSYGNAVSMTSSIEYSFGSAIMTDGFLLNNQLTDFSFVSEKDGKIVANRIEGRKRPRSSMSPMIIFDENNKLYMVIGSPGGSRIIPYVLTTIIAVLDWNMDIQEAINMPKIANLNGPLEIEESIDDQRIKEYFNKIDDEIKVKPLNSGLHGIVVKNGKLYGGADPRREGEASGN